MAGDSTQLKYFDQLQLNQLLLNLHTVIPVEVASYLYLSYWSCISSGNLTLTQFHSTNFNNLSFIPSTLKMESDLFDLKSTFQSSMQPGPSLSTPWGGRVNSPPSFCVSVRDSAWSSLLHVFHSDVFPFWLCYSFLPHPLSLPFACSDPFSSSEAVEGSIPTLNPFLTKHVDPAHPPAVSSDGVSFPSRTSGHELFGGKHTLLFFFCTT